MERNTKEKIIQFIPYIALSLVILVFWVTSEGKLFSPYNIRIVLQQTVALGIICIGAVFIFALGNMDISIGVCVGLCTLIEAMVINATGSLMLGFFLALLLALTFGAINGAVSTWLGLPSIITSLFLMFIGGGFQTIITMQTNTIKVDYNFDLFKQTSFQVLALVVIFAFAYYVFYYTKIGKYACSIGANPSCASQSGISIMKYKVYAYLILGVCIAIASVFVLSRTASSSRLTGNGYQMDVMVALILGGMPLSGGMKSKLSSALLGPFTYTLLTNGLTLSGVSVSQVPFIKAVIFAILVIITCSKRENKVLPR